MGVDGRAKRAGIGHLPASEFPDTLNIVEPLNKLMWTKDAYFGRFFEKPSLLGYWQREHPISRVALLGNLQDRKHIQKSI